MLIVCLLDGSRALRFELVSLAISVSIVSEESTIDPSDVISCQARAFTVGFYSPCLFRVAFCMYVFVLDIASDPGEVRRGRSSHVCSNCREIRPQIRGAEG